MKEDKFTELEISLKLHVRTTKFLNYKPVNNTEMSVVLPTYFTVSSSESCVAITHVTIVVI